MSTIQSNNIEYVSLLFSKKIREKFISQWIPCRDIDNTHRVNGIS